MANDFLTVSTQVLNSFGAYSRKVYNPGMIIILDNYDSFTYNLVQCIETEGMETRVFRNDVVSIDDLAALEPSHLVLSPGPGRPCDTGILQEAIRYFAGKIPVLGVCLGHQAIAEAFGGNVIHAPRLMHGKASDIFHDGKYIYTDLPNPLRGARYHSLIVEEKSLSKDWISCSYTPEKELMGIRHKQFAVEGVQFHPESFLTEDGRLLIRNFLEQKQAFHV